MTSTDVEAASPPATLTHRLSEKSALHPRSIDIFGENATHKTSNKIVTAKYSALTFLPFVLYELLHPNKRFANFFYLVVGILQSWPLISPIEPPYPQSFYSLVLILVVDIVVLAREDMSRHRADGVMNANPVGVISRNAASGQIEEHEETWAGVKVGQVVRVRSKQAFPADLVLLRGSEPPGQAWVNTKPLDGESDMKLRLAPAHGLSPPVGEARADDALEKQLDWERLRGSIHCERPNDKVIVFRYPPDILPISFRSPSDRLPIAFRSSSDLHQISIRSSSDLLLISFHPISI